jgi:glycosyltransferase involved in cell wall biosynthesis
MAALVSVVIPCYRQAHFLAQALDSVLAQTHSAPEIIVIDDGSPDDVLTVVRAFPVVQYRRQENRGLAGARNTGLAQAKGEYIVFLDSDDKLLPHALAAGVAALESHPACAFVWGFNRPIDAQGNPLPTGPGVVLGGASFRQLLEANVVGPPVGVMFRRARVAAVGGFDERLRHAEDYELYLRLAREHPSHCHGDVVAEYRLHDANMSFDHAGMLKGMLAALEAQQPWIGSDAQLRRALAQGRQNARRQFDAEPRVQRVRELLHAGRWVAATACGLSLFMRYPGVLLQVMARRARRSVSPSSA